MSALADSDSPLTDLGPLAWVMDELRKSLDAAGLALRRFAREAQAASGPGDPAPDAGPLRLARLQLHQSVGALEMVGLPAPAQVLRAMESAVQRLVERPELGNEAAVARIEQAGFAIVEFLDALLQGRAVSAVALFPQYREVQALVGAERVHPADLWSLPWAWREPEATRNAPPLTYSPAVRARLDACVLRIVKMGDAAAAGELTDLCAGLAAGQVAREPRSFWSIASAFFEAFALGLLPADLYVKRAASRVLVQYAQLAKGETEVAPRLAQDLAFFCAQAVPELGAAPRLTAARRAWALHRHRPVDYEQPQFGRFDPALKVGVRKRLAAVREAWSALSGGDVSRLRSTGEQLAQLAQALVRLHAPFAPLAEAIAAVGEDTTRAAQAPRAELAMELATAVLFLEAVCQDFDPADVALAARTTQLAQRLEQVRRGRPPEPLEPWIEDLYRQSSDRQTMGSVVDELRATLGELEKNLDAFFRAPQDPGPLHAVPGRLTQMRGVLSVLGLEPAARAAVAMREQVQQLLLSAPQAAAPGFETLGNNLGALGFLIDMLAYQPALARQLFVFDESLGELRPVMGRVAPPEAAEAPVPEPSADEPPADLPTLDSPTLDSPLAQSHPELPVDRPPEVPPQDTPQNTPEPAPPVLQWQALPQAEPATDQAPSAPAEPVPGLEIDELSDLEAFAQLQDLAPQPAPAEPAPPAPAAVSPVLVFTDESAELRAIFIDEACEVIVAAREALATLASTPQDAEALTVLRRAFHTLKGSSRMVGLEVFGEAAWAFEQLLNAWLAEGLPAHDALRRVASEGLEGLSSWVEDITLERDADWTAEPFRAAADALRLEGLERPLQGLQLQAPVLEHDAPPEPLPAPALVPVAPSAVEAIVLPEPQAPLDDAPASDAVRMGTALFNVFLQEADEWSLQLQQDIAHWGLDPRQPLPDALEVLAHSLAGSSATVGFNDLSSLAHRLEASLHRTQSLAWATPQHVAVYAQVAEEIRRLLHQFAAGLLKAPQAPVLEALRALDDLDIPVRSQAAVASEEGADLEALPSRAQAITDRVDADLFPIFEEEAQELLPQLGAALRQWHAMPGPVEPRERALRILHTFKGSARLAGALRLGEAAHELESRIEALGQQADTADLESLLHEFDRLQGLFDALRGAAAPLAAVDVVAVSQEDVLPVPAAEPASEPVSEPAPVSAAPSPAPRAALTLAPPVATHLAPPRASDTAVRVRSQLLDRLMNHTGEVMITRARLEAEMRQLRGALTDLTGNLDRLRSQLRDIELQAETQMQSRLAQSRETSSGFDPLEFDRFTRVQELTRMMAESVNDVATVHRQLQRAVEASEDDLSAQARQTRELQRDLLRTRMVEFESVADRLHRVVRLAAKESGKQVRLDIEGGGIEMDRGVIERMTPAFEHLLRNAVAHGIESPAARVAAGKTPAGHVRITLGHEGNDVSVTFEDDGAGLDLGRIRDKAVALGLLGADQALPTDEAADLIFLPGFSTASEVTELAGRGIGMDVVRAEIQAVGGRIETATQAGGGTCFKLVLPLTTAVTQVVLLRCGEQVFGVPAPLVEIVRRASPREVEQAYNSGQLEQGGEPVGFHWAGALLQVSRRSAEPAGRSIPVVVMRSASQRLALHVDEVLGHQEVVVKNLGPQLSRVPGLAGMTVLASGAVVMIYNPVALAAVHGSEALYFSADQAQPHVLEGGELPVPAGTLVAPLVLVVDDSITVRRVTQRLLQREGWRVALAADGLQALEKLAQEMPAVVLSDIEMPRMDGFDLVRNLRHDERWADLPVIMITSRIAPKHRELAAQLGVNHYLGKPYSEEELLSLVRRYAAMPQPS